MTHIMTDRAVNVVNEAAGNSKDDTFRFIDAAWSIGKEVWHMFTYMIIPEAHMGSTRSSDLSSST